MTSTRHFAALITLAFFACSAPPPAENKTKQPKPPSTTEAAPPTTLAALAVPKPADTPAPAVSGGPAVSASPAVRIRPAPGVVPQLPNFTKETSPGAEGQDFGLEARILLRVAACTGDEPLPPNIDAATVDEHCKQFRPWYEDYQKRYITRAKPFLTKLRPAGLPTVVVYPFGGGDLLSAITTYPDATEITTLSLEHAGDPRRIRETDNKKLAENLAAFRRSIRGLLFSDDSTSENLMKMQRGDIPGQLSFFLVGLAIHGYEPVSLRYFRVEVGGGLHYLSQEEIAAVETRTAKKLNTVWVSPDFSEAFSNMELTFRARGAKDAPVKVHRHIAANLADDHLTRDPSVLKHLEAKGKVSAMTKAASYLLWNAAFTKIRGYLLSHMVFMFSDSTGIPPRFAAKAGFIQETYGHFTNSFLEASKAYNEEFLKLWDGQPQRDLPFRYGYPDASKANHMLVTRAPVEKAS